MLSCSLNWLTNIYDTNNRYDLSIACVMVQLANQNNNDLVT